MFDILYTHPDFIVVIKHPNVSVHKDEGETMLLQEVATKTGDPKLYLVHRLDKMTSGLLLLARSSKAASALATLFSDREIEKYYLAIGSSKPKKKQGAVIGDMERSRRSTWKLINRRDNPAITQFFSTASGQGERLLLCKPHTGKTHQIRVALKSVGSAIVGDAIYNASCKADRGYLHAFALRFNYLNEEYKFISDPRESTELGTKWRDETTSQAIEFWLKPWELSWPKIKM